MARAILLAAILAGCGPGGARRAPAASAPPSSGPAPRAADAGPVDAAPPPVSEVHARALMARRFRAAGLRIREDVPVAGVTLDGCDPERRVGYEYIAPEERGLEVTAERRAALEALADWQILIVDATDQEALRRLVEQFVSALAPAGSSSSASGR